MLIWKSFRDCDLHRWSSKAGGTVHRSTGSAGSARYWHNARCLRHCLAVTCTSRYSSWGCKWCGHHELHTGSWLSTIAIRTCPVHSRSRSDGVQPSTNRPRSQYACCTYRTSDLKSSQQQRNNTTRYFSLTLRPHGIARWVILVLADLWFGAQGIWTTVSFTWPRN